MIAGIYKEDNGQKNITINLAEEDMKKLIAEAVAKINKKFEIPKDKEEILGFCEDFGIET